jgi:hypothetical protein
MHPNCRPCVFPRQSHLAANHQPITPSPFSPLPSSQNHPR